MARMTKPSITLPEGLRCAKCDLPLVIKQTGFAYLGRSFHTDALVCPGCGNLYLPPELARGRMKEVETTLEDK